MDYYETLGVSRQASEDEIKKAYRKLAKTHHPDATQGDKDSEEKFKVISEAYETLSNPQKRQQYDNPEIRHHGPFGSMGDYEDLLRGFHNIRPQRPPHDQPMRGQDLKYVVDVPLVDFILGGEVSTQVTYRDPCQACNGTGAKTTEPCGNCGGSGQVVERRGSGNMVMQTVSTCPVCRGQGRRAVDNCSVCNSSGSMFVRDHTITAHIPAGSRDGDITKRPSEGGQGVYGGPRGDLYIKFRMVLPNKQSLSEAQIELLKSL